jgi:hypothetical protein
LFVLPIDGVIQACYGCTHEPDAARDHPDDYPYRAAIGVAPRWLACKPINMTKRGATSTFFVLSEGQS